MNRVLALYAVSGFVSLGYQVAWLRIHVDRFGSTDLTFVLVLCNFIGGLGVGALCSRRVSDALARSHPAPLARYGVIELCVSAAALLTMAAALVPADLFGAFPYADVGGIYEPILALQTFKIAVATLCVFVPCFFMGVTFPLLCDAWGDDARFPALLYAWNTLGACSGVLAAEFVLIPWLGHDRMFLALIAVNALLGLYFWLAGAKVPTRAGTTAPPSGSEAKAAGPSVGVLLACAALSGLLAGSLEADLFKRLSFLGIRTSTTMSFVSFWAVLAIFLASALVRAWPTLGFGRLKAAYALTLPVFLWTTLQVYDLHAGVFGALSPAHTQDVAMPLRFFFPAGLAPLFLFVGALVFPTFFLLSLLLPWACNQLQGQRRHLGRAYGTNTVAFCVGTIAFTWVAPRVSIFYSLKLQLALLAVGVAFFFLLPARGRLAAWKPAVALSALLVAAVATPADFDRRLMMPGTPPTERPVRAMKSDSSYTTFVVDHPDGDMLYFDNVSLSNASPRQQTYMGLMAHFPLLAHPDPKDVLLICYGVGNTAGAITTHASVERIDVVDLSRNVLLTAPEFADTNEGAHRDPRLRFIHDDGRAFLATTDRRYDLVTSEPPPPLHTGVYRLYSREYYRDVLDHLTPQGLMTQWVPVVQMPPEAVERSIRTFVEVFPHTLLFSGMREELVLVGSPAPISLATLERRFETDPRVSAHLARLGVPDAKSLLTRLVQGDASLRRRYAAADETGLVTDAHNDLAHLFLDPTQPGAVPYDPAGVFGEINGEDLENEALLREVFLHLGRLQHHAPGFPVSSLVAMQREGIGGALLADVDWEAVFALERRAERARESGRLEEARTALNDALALTPAQPKLLLRLATVEAMLGDREGARAALVRFLAIEPTDAKAWHRLATLHERSGDAVAAIDAYRQTLHLDPARDTAALRLAWLLATHPDAELRDGDEAWRWSGRVQRDDATPLAVRAAAAAENGAFEMAAALQADAAERAPAHLKGDYESALAVYRAGRPYRGGIDGPRAYPWRLRSGTE